MSVCPAHSGGNRAGWKYVTLRLPDHPLINDARRLYHISKNPRDARDLKAQHDGGVNSMAKRIERLIQSSMEKERNLKTGAH
jgi:hypothetical protein